MKENILKEIELRLRSIRDSQQTIVILKDQINREAENIQKYITYIEDTIETLYTK